MFKTLVLCTHSRPIHAPTLQALNALRRAGAAVLDHGDAPTDVTLARNLGLSAACEQLDRMPERDLVLLVGDDMIFAADDAQALADHARSHVRATSAIYLTAAGELAAVRLKRPAGAPPRWLTGLGLLAVPASALLALRAASAPFVFGGERFAFTQSAADGGQYLSEDFTLCRRLGGVDLLPIAVGHLQTVAIYPTDDVLFAVRRGAVPPRGSRAVCLLPARAELTGLTEAEYQAAEVGGVEHSRFT